MGLESNPTEVSGLQIEEVIVMEGKALDRGR